MQFILNCDKILQISKYIFKWKLQNSLIQSHINDELDMRSWETNWSGETLGYDIRL